MNVQMGDLAWIINAEFPENMDRIVLVGEFAGMREYTRLGPAPTWNVVAQGSPLCCFRGDSIVHTHRAVAPDCCLRPIRPSAQPERIVTQETLTA